MTTPARIYADGLRDGIEMTLMLALGEESESGGVPFGRPESLPEDFTRWAQTALVKIRDDRLVPETVAHALYVTRTRS